MRKTMKFLHTVSSAGLVGGMAAYMVILVGANPASIEAYADLRASISAISNYLLLPSLGIALVTGLLAMVVHKPYIEKAWVWVKAALGILMFKGVLTIISAKADYATSVSAKVASGEVPASALDGLLLYEWYTLAAVMVLSIANFVLGVWRPRLTRQKKPAHSKKHRPAVVAAAEEAPMIEDRARPAA
ncbi:MAG: DUF2269 family protein [Pseudomonadota bacterium]